MPDHPQKNRDTAGYEKRDVNVRAMAGFGIGLLLGLWLVFVVTRAILTEFREHRSNGNSGPANQSALTPEPKLQSDPAGDFARFREQQKDLLNSYGWIDRKAGIVRIPIEQAMDLIAAHGLPEPSAESIGKTPLQMQQNRITSRRTSP